MDAVAEKDILWDEDAMAVIRSKFARESMAWRAPGLITDYAFYQLAGAKLAEMKQSGALDAWRRKTPLDATDDLPEQGIGCLNQCLAEYERSPAQFTRRLERAAPVRQQSVREFFELMSMADYSERADFDRLKSPIPTGRCWLYLCLQEHDKEGPKFLSRLEKAGSGQKEEYLLYLENVRKDD
jgi:hypothetical protein